MTTVLSNLSSSGFGISNYGELKDAVLRWLNRSSESSTADDVPTFVRLAETSIRRDIRVRVQEAFEIDTAEEETITVPDLFLEARRLIVGGKRKDYATPEEFQDLTAATSQANRYTVIGQEIYVLGGATDLDYSLLYWEAFASFVNDTDTNWLLINAPEVYLWLSCKEGAEFLKDYEAADRFGSKYRDAVDTLNNSEKQMRIAGSQLRVRPAGSTP